MDDIDVLLKFLAPLLPFLRNAGDAGNDELGRKAAGGLWDAAKSIFVKLRSAKVAKPHSELEPSKSTGADAVEPVTEEWVATRLAASPSLAKELILELRAAQRPRSSSGGLISAGRIDSSIVVIGDGNSVNSPDRRGSGQD
jgi:hypothetical protein